MRTAEQADRGRAAAVVVAAPGQSRRWVWPGLAFVLAGGLALRLWGVQQGLPYAYNADEADHFVPRAIQMFQDGSLNPHYFANPPAYTYLLHYLFAIYYGGGAGALRAFQLHPAEVYTLARVVAALLGTVALWLLYATGARLFNRGVGLLAAAIEAVAFLPVFYAHLALNDVPTLAPLSLSLLGSAGVLRKGRPRDYLLAGIGLGLACASKYTAGIALLPLLAAACARYPDARRPAARSPLAALVGGLFLAGLATLAAFVIANPYALLDYHSFHAELVHQSTLSAEAQGKLGAPKQGGLLYYLWSFTWGLGWVPALAGLGGALAVWTARDGSDGGRRLGWPLVPPVLVFLAFMGLQGRYFGRWLMPIFPIVCLLAAFFALSLAELGARSLARASRPSILRQSLPRQSLLRPALLRPALTVLVVAALLGQGLIYSVHSGLVLSRADTRGLTRQWMLAHIPKGAAIVAEPVSPDDWARETPVLASPSDPYHWVKYPSLLSRLAANRTLQASTHEVGIENYETTLAPALLGYYRAHGYCWVISGSTQSGRAFADPNAVPGAIAYYRALAQQGEVAYRASPYAHGRAPVSFDFDWSFDYYPLAYQRPGPTMTVYRLHGGRCGP